MEKRQILFKAIKANGTGWVEGNYNLIDGKHYVFPLDGLDSYDNYEVKPETVCMFFREKDGVKYFENDRVLVKGNKRTGKYETHIVFDGRMFRLADNRTIFQDFASTIAIIDNLGNIHDHETA